MVIEEFEVRLRTLVLTSKAEETAISHWTKKDRQLALLPYVGVRNLGRWRPSNATPI